MSSRLNEIELGIDRGKEQNECVKEEILEKKMAEE